MSSADAVTLAVSLVILFTFMLRHEKAWTGRVAGALMLVYWISVVILGRTWHFS